MRNQGLHKIKKTHGDRIHKTPKGKKHTAEKQPNTPLKANKHKPMDSDEDDEKPQNEPGNSSISQTVPVLPRQQGPVANYKDQQQVRKDQMQVLLLVMKTVRTAMSTVHRVKTLEEQYSIQIFTFLPMMNSGQ